MEDKNKKVMKAKSPVSKTLMTSEKACCHSESKVAEEQCCCHSEPKVAEESCCCHSEPKATEGSCCSHSEPKVAVESCCSHSESKAAEEQCCCHSEPKIAEESCCCHSEPKAAEEQCCCHSEPKIAEESCCCSGGEKNKAQATLKKGKKESHAYAKEEEKQSYKSCCSGGEENQSYKSCCSGGEEKQSYKSCCSGGEENQSYKSCCSGGEEKQSYKSCCSSGGENDGGGCCHGGGKTKLSAKNKLIMNIVILVLSVGSLIAGFFNWHEIGGVIGKAFYYVNPSWLAVILCGIPIFKSAIRILLKKKINASVLISMGILASVGLEIASFFVQGSGSHGHSYVFAAGEIAFLMKIGEMLEDFTVGKCRSGINRLVGLIPKVANVLIGGEVIEKPLSQIAIGDIVVVKAGEMVSVDGVVIGGEGVVDEASVTGEYLPKEVTTGNHVYGGTFNISGALSIKVEKLQKDMTIAKMAELTQEAAGKKAPISRLADKWVSYIVPVVFVVSIAVGLIATYAFNLGVMDSLIRAITVLVVFCPCALALATPTAIAAGLGFAAKRGVLVKSGATLEELSRINTICFDKTGTLTEGKIEVKEVCSKGEKGEFLKYMASVEKFSDHPIAAAIIKASGGESFEKADNIRTLHGVGIEGKVNGKQVEVVSLSSAKNRDIDTSIFESEIEASLMKGYTVVVMLIDGKFEGVVACADTIRENSVQTVDSLHRQNYQTIMLTGDNEHSANYIAEKCGLDKDSVRFGLLPQDKIATIESLQKDGKKVCMLGDGINDAPALKLANCGVAMGALGSDIAIDSADITIMNSDIAKIDDTLALSKRVMSTIKVNILIAMSINVIAVILSTFGILTPVTGAIVHNVTSVLVVASSSLLLIRGRKKGQKNTKKVEVESEK